MTQENKDLLLRDLCMRLPYGVKCEIKCEKEVYTLNRIEIDHENGHLLDFVEQKNGFNMQVYSSEVKPYLFPMSNITKEQFKEYWELEHSGDMEHLSTPLLDWLLKNYFDLFGLIPQGRANDATGLGIYE